MKKQAIILFLFLTVLAFDCSAENGRGIKLTKKDNALRTALVIGNWDYKNSPLRNPQNDAKAMAGVLKESGFDVTVEINASQRVMENAVRNFGQKLKKGGTGLFYYAGHGIQVKGRNYLVPIGATIESESDVKYGAVDAGLVLGKMEDAGNDLNIVILDACRNNPFVRSFRSSVSGLARMDAPKGSLIAYATSPGSVAADGEDGNGIYTKYLIQNMKKPGLTVEQILKKVRVSVVSDTSSKQVPWESSSLMGDFYFFKDDVNLKDKPSPYTKIDVEEEMWSLIKDSKKANDFEIYLRTYPDGRFSNQAKIQIRNLSPRKQTPPPMETMPATLSDETDLSERNKLVGSWAWHQDEQRFLSNGKGIYYRDGDVCYEFNYTFIHDILHSVAEKPHTCGASTDNKFRISLSGKSLTMEHIGSGYKSKWIKK